VSAGFPRIGYHSVTPRLVVSDVPVLVDFLQRVFAATGEPQPGRPVEMRVGDSLIMISSTAERDAFPGFLYVYVASADGAYEAALEAGATSLEAPFDTPYGDRRAMVRDQFGNVFQIAHPVNTSSSG
jgi:PhnB protein